MGAKEARSSVDLLREEVCSLRRDVDNIRSTVQDMHREVGSAVLLLSRFVGVQWDASDLVRVAEERSALASSAVDRLAEGMGNLEKKVASSPDCGGPGGYGSRGEGAGELRTTSGGNALASSEMNLGSGIVGTDRMGENGKVRSRESCRSSSESSALEETGGHTLQKATGLACDQTDNCRGEGSASGEYTSSSSPKEDNPLRPTLSTGHGESATSTESETPEGGKALLKQVPLGMDREQLVSTRDSTVPGAVASLAVSELPMQNHGRWLDEGAQAQEEGKGAVSPVSPRELPARQQSSSGTATSQLEDSDEAREALRPTGALKSGDTRRSQKHESDNDPDIVNGHDGASPETGTEDGSTGTQERSDRHALGRGSPPDRRDSVRRRAGVAGPRSDSPSDDGEDESSRNSGSSASSSDGY